MTVWWKQRGNKVKTGPNYQAVIPQLIDKNIIKSDQNIAFQDALIPQCYFELQHFYKWYHDSFDYNQYIKDQRNKHQKYLMQKQEEMDKLLAKQSQFRRSKRFKDKNGKNYKEYSPTYTDDDIDDHSLSSSAFSSSIFSSSSENETSSDEEYIIPSQRNKNNNKNKNKNRNGNRNKNANKKVTKVRMTGKKRKLSEIVHLVDDINLDKDNKKKKRKIVSKSIDKKRVNDIIAQLNTNCNNNRSLKLQRQTNNEDIIILSD